MDFVPKQKGEMIKISLDICSKIGNFGMLEELLNSLTSGDSSKSKQGIQTMLALQPVPSQLHSLPHDVRFYWSLAFDWAKVRAWREQNSGKSMLLSRAEKPRSSSASRSTLTFSALGLLRASALIIRDVQTHNDFRWSTGTDERQMRLCGRHG